MQIYKILNNNAAVVCDKEGREKIVMGKGICFQKKAGAQIDAAAVDKVFFYLKRMRTINSRYW